MTERRKQALIILAVGTPLLIFGGFKFELGGATSSIMAILLAISLTGGMFLTLGGLVMLFTKKPLGILNSMEITPKPTDEVKEMVKTKKEKPKPIDLGRTTRKSGSESSGLVRLKSGSESIGLMQREKELVKRADELNALVNEVETELNQVRENLETKGWVNSENGWVIE